MKVRALLLACGFLAPATSLTAQTKSAADPISGTWIGFIARSETQKSSMTLALKFDGASVVTGTGLPANGAPIALIPGTFDLKTGGLKFAVDAGGEGHFEFSGKLVKDSLNGDVVNGATHGQFHLARKGTEAAAAPSIKPTPGTEALAAVRRGFVEVSGWVTRSADMVPAEKYSYRPVNTVRTFGEIIGHVADAYNYYCGRATGKDVQWTTTNEKGPQAKTALTAALKKSLDACTAAYENGAIGVLMENVAHTSLHYGNLVTYLRMIGLTPPSS